ncbi:MAG: prolipoprotein diacylglyceryl transferase [Oscillospiraceae bacterium]|nr:prolipoprotein diacylglyceryl transferase [Oscillospiraceae bacterium]
MEPIIRFFGFSMNPPRSLSVFGFPIYLYGIIIALGFGLAVAYALKRRDDFGLSKDNVLDIFLCAIVGGLVGARLYYVIFNPSDYFGAGKWLNIFKLREGGLAVYGGIIAGCAAVVIYAKRKKLRFAPMLDLGGLGLLIGQAIGRWGNFINREAFGSETGMPWAMGLEFSNGAVMNVHPTFLYESLWNALGFVLLHNFSKRRKQYDGQVFVLYMLWYGLGRVWIEGLRTDSLYIGSTSLRISQLVAAACIAVAVGILLYQRSKRANANK